MLDEPSIGLHQRDNERLITTLHHLRDLANGEYKLPWDENVKIRDGWKYYPDGVQLGPLPK